MVDFFSSLYILFLRFFLFVFILSGNMFLGCKVKIIITPVWDCWCTDRLYHVVAWEGEGSLVISRRSWSLYAPKADNSSWEQQGCQVTVFSGVQPDIMHCSGHCDKQNEYALDLLEVSLLCSHGGGRGLQWLHPMDAIWGEPIVSAQMSTPPSTKEGHATKTWPAVDLRS